MTYIVTNKKIANDLLSTRMISFLLVLFIVLLVTENTSIAPPFLNYIDDFYALLCFCLVITFKRTSIKLRKLFVSILFFLLLFVVVGLVPNLLYPYQISSLSVIIDVFSNIKFFLAIITTVVFLNDRYCFLHFKKIALAITKLFLVFLFLLSLLSFFDFLVFNNDFRYGIKVTYLFFNHPTYYAAVSFFLGLLVILLNDYKKSTIIYVLISLIMCAMSLRTKALVSVFAFLFLCLVFSLKRKSVLLIIILSLFGFSVALFLGYESYNIYFVGTNSARSILTMTSLHIAQDYFPFGTGFGTFASYESGKNYSLVYFLYNIEGVWGLTQMNHSFISDTFWPMILGQSGVAGLLLYTIALLKLSVDGFKLLHIKQLKLVFLSSLCYLLISSTSESSFVNPLSILFAIAIGICFVKDRFEQRV